MNVNTNRSLGEIDSSSWMTEELKTAVGVTNYRYGGTSKRTRIGSGASRYDRIAAIS